MTKNGYTEIEIEGKKIGLKFNMYCFEILQPLLIKANNIKSAVVASTVYAGMLGNCYAKQIEPTLTFEEIDDFVNDLVMHGDTNGVLNKINEVMIGSNVFHVQENGSIEDEIKKKMETQMQ